MSFSTRDCIEIYNVVSRLKGGGIVIDGITVERVLKATVDEVEQFARTLQAKGREMGLETSYERRFEGSTGHRFCGADLMRDLNAVIRGIR